jgi:hypothetical protein
MEVEIEVQLRRIEFVQRLGTFGGYVAIADELAYDGPVFAFHQSVVLAAAARLLVNRLHSQVSRTSQRLRSTLHLHSVA